tara:strand:- start:15 stop:800 length:786 start_codon:yes stop_codon:yes gene_type:complete
MVMQKIIIGKKGFIFNAIKNKFLDSRSFIFISLDEIETIPSDFYGEFIILSFPRVCFSRLGYDHEIELKILKRFNANNIYITYLSTSKVYPDGQAITEEQTLDPQSIYAENKIIAESFIKDNFQNYRILRGSNFLSSAGGAQNSFFEILKKNFNQKKSFIFDITGKSLKDFVHVSFLIDFLYEAPFKKGIYNFSSGIGISIFEIIDNLTLGNEINLKDLKIELGDITKSQILLNNKLIIDHGIQRVKKEVILDAIQRIKLK